MTMKTLLPLMLAVVAWVGLLATSSAVSAQQPKMDIKLFAGASATTFVSMLKEGRERETFAGWQIGFGPRVRKRQWFVEALLSFNRWTFRLSFEDVGSVALQVNSFELPLNAGFIPYKNALFKLYLYGGFVNHFNTKILITVDGDRTKFRPKELEIAIYQALARFGINFDVAMFNFDFNYSISMNSATHTSYRTGYHQLQLNAAYLF
jgi:hypothetical protein